MRHIEPFLRRRKGNDIAVLYLFLANSKFAFINNPEYPAGNFFFHREQFLPLLFVSQRRIKLDIFCHKINFPAPRPAVQRSGNVRKDFLFPIITEPIGEIMQAGGITINDTPSIAD